MGFPRLFQVMEKRGSHVQYDRFAPTDLEKQIATHISINILALSMHIMRERMGLMSRAAYRARILAVLVHAARMPRQIPTILSLKANDS